MTKEQQYLLIKAERSLNASKELNEKDYPDFATSRAYYTIDITNLKQILDKI